MLVIPYITLVPVIFIYVRTVGCITKYGCYGSPDLVCSHHNLSCGDGEIIGIDAPWNPISVLGKIELPGCDAIVERDSCRKSCCGQAGLAHKCPRNKHQSLANQSMTYSVGDPESKLDNFVIDVHRNCSLRRSCTVVPPFYDTNHTSSCIRYNFICIEESLVYNMVKTFSVLKHNTIMLSFIGKGRHKHITLNCSCKVQSSNEIRMTSLYIHLKNNTNDQVKISTDRRLPFDREYDVNIIYGQMVTFSTYPFTIEFSNFVPSEDDVIWIEFLTVGHFLNATCSGCDVPLWNLKVPVYYDSGSFGLTRGFGSPQLSLVLNMFLVLLSFYFLF